MKKFLQFFKVLLPAALLLGSVTAWGETIYLTEPLVLNSNGTYSGGCSQSLSYYGISYENNTWILSGKTLVYNENGGTYAVEFGGDVDSDVQVKITGNFTIERNHPGNSTAGGVLFKGNTTVYSENSSTLTVTSSAPNLSGTFTNTGIDHQGDLTFDKSIICNVTANATTGNSNSYGIFCIAGTVQHSLIILDNGKVVSQGGNCAFKDQTGKTTPKHSFTAKDDDGNILKYNLWKTDGEQYTILAHGKKTAAQKVTLTKVIPNYFTVGTMKCLSLQAALDSTKLEGAPKTITMVEDYVIDKYKDAGSQEKTEAPEIPSGVTFDCGDHVLTLNGKDNHLYINSGTLKGSKAIVDANGAGVYIDGASTITVPEIPSVIFDYKDKDNMVTLRNSKFKATKIKNGEDLTITLENSEFESPQTDRFCYSLSIEKESKANLTGKSCDNVNLMESCALDASGMEAQNIINVSGRKKTSLKSEDDSDINTIIGLFDDARFGTVKGQKTHFVTSKGFNFQSNLTLEDSAYVALRASENNKVLSLPKGKGLTMTAETCLETLKGKAQGNDVFADIEIAAAATLDENAKMTSCRNINIESTGKLSGAAGTEFSADTICNKGTFDLKGMTANEAKAIKAVVINEKEASLSYAMLENKFINRKDVSVESDVVFSDSLYNAKNANIWQQAGKLTVKDFVNDGLVSVNDKGEVKTTASFVNNGTIFFKGDETCTVFSDGTFANKEDGVISVTDSAYIRFMKEADNYGTIFMKNNSELDLEQVSTTVDNYGEIVLDITGEATPFINDFNKLQQKDGAKVLVNALTLKQPFGEYTLAVNSGDVAEGTAFYITSGIEEPVAPHSIFFAASAEKVDTMEIVLGGEPVLYGDRGYELKMGVEGDIVLTCFDPIIVVTLGDLGKGTIYSPFNFIVPKGMTVQSYGVDLEHKNFIKDVAYTEYDIVPGKKGYVITGTPGTYTFKPTYLEVSKTNESCLEGSYSEKSVEKIEGQVYVFDVIKDLPGFYKYLGKKVGANKAYFRTKDNGTQQYNLGSTEEWFK